MVDVSVVAANVNMLMWEIKFLEKLAKLRIITQEFKRYVDDVLALLKVINVGWAYDRTLDKMAYKLSSAQSKLREAQFSCF